jgi:predicted small secreted protein
MNKRKSTPYSYYKFLAAILLLTAPVVSGCQNSPQGVDEDVIVAIPSPSGEVVEIDELAGIPEISMAELAKSMDAETLYIDNCAKCHGLTGLGDGPSVGSLNTQYGLNLTILQNMSEDEIREIISVGKGMEMPPWELLLNEEQLQALTDYVRSLADS